jgi:hypothetical protein
VPSIPRARPPSKRQLDVDWTRVTSPIAGIATAQIGDLIDADISTLARFAPGLDDLLGCQRDWLAPDVMAGISAARR